VVMKNNLVENSQGATAWPRKLMNLHFVKSVARKRLVEAVIYWGHYSVCEWSVKCSLAWCTQVVNKCIHQSIPRLKWHTCKYITVLTVLCSVINLVLISLQEITHIFSKLLSKLIRNTNIKIVQNACGYCECVKCSNFHYIFRPRHTYIPPTWAR
jgi:hypothetical protein